MTGCPAADRLIVGRTQDEHVDEITALCMSHRLSDQISTFADATFCIGNKPPSDGSYTAGIQLGNGFQVVGLKRGDLLSAFAPAALHKALRTVCGRLGCRPGFQALPEASDLEKAYPGSVPSAPCAAAIRRLTVPRLRRFDAQLARYTNRRFARIDRL